MGEGDVSARTSVTWRPPRGAARRRPDFLLGSVAVLAASPLPGPGGSAAASSAPASAAPSDQGLPASQAPASAGLASEKPDADFPEAAEPSEKPEVETEDNSTDGALHAIDRLTAAGIKTTPDVFQKTAASSRRRWRRPCPRFRGRERQDAGSDPGNVPGRHGLGQISKNLHLSIGPGIGWIMGQGHGNGAAKAKPSKPAKP